MSRGTQAPDPPRPPPLVPTGLSPSLVGRPRPFGSDSVGIVYAVETPCGAPGLALQPRPDPFTGTPAVWAAPGSLAATTGISERLAPFSFDVSSSEY